MIFNGYSLLISILISPISDNRNNDSLLVNIHRRAPVPVDDVPVAVVLSAVLREGEINENNKK